MSDLISRSKVISVLEQLEEHSLTGKMDISNAIYLLNNTPTAYDIYKVVEELEERTDFLKDCTKYGNKNAEQQAESYSTMMMYEVADLVDDLTEIVKHGGVADDVCKWKYTKEIMDNAEFKVGCNPNALKRGVVPNNFSYHDFKYCPYCGKKIKVVE